MSDESLFSITIGGQAGQGIKSSGLTLAKVASRSGYRVHTYTEFPSLIRGGHNVIQILVSPKEVSAPVKHIHLLIALNQDTINRHRAELSSGGGVIYDSDKKIDTSFFDPGLINLFPVPLSKFANTAGSSELLVNTVSIAAAVALLGGDAKILETLIREEFADKGEAVINSNLTAIQSGFEYAKANFNDKIKSVLAPVSNPSPHMIVNGAEAIALGAIAGGLQFSAIYPMSPASNILSTLALYQEQYGYIYKQPEDEISAVGMCIGAGFAGARALTATSGGGFSLMVESLGLAAMTETPLVIVEGMRPGPATGLPTWNAQGDLQFVLHAHQGDFPRIVLAAGCAQEAFDLTIQALNLADKYQTPVILLVDKNILDDDWSVSPFDVSGYLIDRGKLTADFNPEFTRYAPEADGVSYRSIPGTGNFFIANSDEHNASGFSSEDVTDIVSQQTKRMTKLKTCADTEMPPPQIFGPENADVTLVSWGSNKGSILSALESFPQANYLHLTWMNPFPAEAVKTILNSAKRVISIEANYSGQLAKLIAEKTGFLIQDQLLKFDGRPIYPEEIITKLNSILSAKT